MNLQIVTSCYNDIDKFDWHGIFNGNLLIYNKGEPIPFSNSVKIPNYGRCDYSFFYHIVHNYDDLFEHTIFTKINWKNHYSNLIDLIRDAENLYDFSDVGVRLEHHYWSGNPVPGALNINHSPELFPKVLCQNCIPAYCSDFLIDTIFGERPEEANLWSHGPSFLVSKELIRRHPLSTYEFLLNCFTPSSNSWDHKKALEFFNGDEEAALEDIGKHYHDEFLRFYRTLFTHKATNFKIKTNE